jgi:hypothetical protein
MVGTANIMTAEATSDVPGGVELTVDYGPEYYGGELVDGLSVWSGELY